MKRVYGLMISLAMLLAATGLASADTSTAALTNQQAISAVIARALSQRGVPYAYGGGDITGPTRGIPQPDPAAIDPSVSTLGATSGAGVFGVPQSAGPVTSLGAAPIVPPVVDPTPSSADANVVGFDSSGLIVYAFAGAGIKMPRSSGQQYTVGRKIPPSLALPGDLIFYGPDGSQSVALFIGNGQMVEATNPAVTVSAVRTNDMAPYLTRIIG